MNINVKCVLFGFMAVLCAFTMLFTGVNILIDLHDACKGTLHTRSKSYRKYVKECVSRRNTYDHDPITRDDEIEEKAEIVEAKHYTDNGDETRMNCVKSVGRLYATYFAQDTTGWIIIAFISEITELLIQSDAMMVYNGYSIFDPNHEKNIYQANKSIITMLTRNEFIFFSNICK